MQEFIFNQVRVQLLSKDVVRLEQTKRGRFCDDNTYFIPNRASLGGYDGISRNEEGADVVIFDNVKIIVPSGETLNGVQVLLNGKKVYTYKKSHNSGELPSIDKTPAVYTVSDNPRVKMPKQGYRAGAKYTVCENVADVYLLFCNCDHRKLRKLYVELTGRTEMARLSTLGFWNSRYYKHDERSAKQMIRDYIDRGVPLDNMVLDTDWRKASDRGIGYEIDDVLFPDMKAFLRYAHDNGVEIMFNDHPEPVAGAKSLFDRREIKYRSDNLKAHLELGLDYWWYDRNWRTKLVSPTKRIHPESFGSYLFYDVTKQYFQKQASNEVYRRPVIMSNVDNISNGNYEGINDSASHRYSIQWTGDIPSDDSSIAAEIKNMILAQNSCVTYVNADCGGHTGNPSKKEFIRWMQFGAFSPVFRPHCTMGVSRFREPWAYDEQTFGIVREFVKMRYRLLPEIYKNAYESYLCGQPLFKQLSYDYADDPKARNATDEYLLGDGILIAPLRGKAPRKLGLENYCSEVSATYYDGCEHKGAPLWQTSYRKLDLYWNHVAPDKSVPVYNFSAVFETKVMFKKDVELIVESDDGVTAVIDGKVTLEDKTFHSASKMKAGILSANEIHSVKLYYFQGGGEASISLFYNEINDKYNLDRREVYLPAGDWIDAFSGAELKGGKTYSREYDCREMPLFIKKGSVIPLLESAQNTKLLDWSTLTLDFYPSKTAEYRGYLYEDDKVTTAYQQGVIRTSEYSAKYDPERNSVILRLAPCQGKYDDGMTVRNVTVKYHLLKEVKQLKKILVDGRPVPHERHEGDGGAYPLSVSSSVDPTVTVSFKRDLSAETEIEFVLK